MIIPVTNRNDYLANLSADRQDSISKQVWDKLWPKNNKK